MNNQHPVINDELIRKWLGEHFSRFTSNSTWLAPLAKSTATGEVSDSERYLATQAADWQLEQVIKFIAKEDTVYYDTPTLLADYIKQAMRPQEDQ